MAEWTKTEVRRQICDAIASKVSGAGFRYVKRSEAFVRKIVGGRQELVVALVDYRPTFQFSFSLCIRLEAVQEITNRFSGAPPKYHDITLTSITQLEFLCVSTPPGQNYEFEVNSELELGRLMPDVLTIMQQRVLPFFEHNDNIAAVNRGLNPEGAERAAELSGGTNRHAFNGSDQPYRAMSAVAAAYIARDSRFPSLVANCRNQISGVLESDRAKFEKMVDYLIANGETDI